MKWAKSVKVKKRARASGSCGTGLSGCRPASSATIRGDADPTWCTCSSALGRPAMKEVRSGRGGGVGAHGGPVCRNPVARAAPRLRVGRCHDPTRPLAAPHRAARAAPAHRRRGRRGGRLAQPPRRQPVAPEHRGRPGGVPSGCGVSGADDPFDHHVVGVADDGAVVGTVSRDGAATGWARGTTRRRVRSEGSARLPARPGPPRPRLRDRDGARRPRPRLRRPRACAGSPPAASPTTSPRGG